MTTGKIILYGTGAIILAVLIFFNFDSIATWATLNNPFQGQWAVVQLSDGEVLYGHFAGVSGSTIGLRDVYLLDKFTPAAPADNVSTSTGLSIGATFGQTQQQPTYVPVSDTDLLFINRTSVLYFKFLSLDDPALPYLH